MPSPSPASCLPLPLSPQGPCGHPRQHNPLEGINLSPLENWIDRSLSELEQRLNHFSTRRTRAIACLHASSR